MLNDYFTKNREKRIKELREGDKLNNEEWFGLILWLACMVMLGVIISTKTK